MDSFWVVLDSNGSYVGTPCKNFEECRELVTEKEGRIAYEVDANFCTIFDGKKVYYSL